MKTNKTKKSNALIKEFLEGSPYSNDEKADLSLFIDSLTEDNKLHLSKIIVMPYNKNEVKE